MDVKTAMVKCGMVADAVWAEARERPIVRSLLENDLYKLSMMQVMLHQSPGVQAEYTFVCRNTPAYPLAALAADINRELDRLCTLRFTEDELDYLRTLRFLKPDFIDFLAIFQFQRKFIQVLTAGDVLHVRAKGPIVHVMGFEIFVLYIVNELYFRRFDPAPLLEEGRRRLRAKIERLKALEEVPDAINPFTFFDFGLRRRFSAAWQEEVVATLARNVPQYFRGTSNVYLAKKYDIVPIGTMAHEILQLQQALNVRLRDFQREGLEAWCREFRGDLGIALTDVISMDAFLADFDLYFAKLFDGLRHDSGDPFVWGEKALAHYAKLKIDARTKRLVFSDALDFDKALALYRHFASRAITSFGIGTHLANDMGMRTLNIVMKLIRCNEQPVAKLSDEPAKILCDDEVFLAYLMQEFRYHLPEFAREPQ